MESYIVRVYRRDREDPHEVVGLVEKVGMEEKQAFHSLTELCEILSEPLGVHVPSEAAAEPAEPAIAAKAAHTR